MGAHQFQPHPLNVYNAQLGIRGVFTVIATKYLLTVGLLACSVSCGGLFLSSFGVAQISNSNGLNGKNLTFSLYP